MRFLLLLVAIAARAQTIEGAWHGALDVGAMKLRLNLNLSRSEKGLTASLQSVDQGRAIIPAQQAAFAEGQLTLKFPSVGASYQGKLDSAGTKLSGTFSQNGADLPLIFERGAPPEPERPQTPKPPFPYNSEDVSFPNESAGIKLAGTLTWPKNGGGFPAVVLITGSGPQDRDESILGHKPFLVLADYLTRHGIAVLRVDDRGTGKSTGNFNEATTSDFATDTEAALDYLKNRKEINPKRIGLIGHSEGGVIAPMVAARRSDVAFIVLMAGTGVPGDEVLKVQAAKIMLAMGAPQSAVDQNARIQKILLDAAKSGASRDEVAKKLKAEIEKLVAQAAESDKASLSAFAERSYEQTALVTSKWFREFMNYDPASALRKVKVPVLALNGELDTQVDAAQNLPAIVKALEEGRNSDYAVIKFPDLNHLFQTAKTGAPSEYAEITETLAVKVVATIAEWISGK